MDSAEFFHELDKLKRSRVALSSSSTEERNEALNLISEGLLRDKEEIFSQNRKDLENARGKLAESVMKRLLFDEKKLESSIKGIRDVMRLPDPIGKVLEKRELNKNLVLSRISFPIGTIGMIFESRPDALIQIVSLAIKSGNALVLKGGKEAECTNRALFASIKNALSTSSLGSDYLIQIESHEDVDRILKLDRDIDLLIPRGSNAFVKRIMENSNIPVLGHADGVCTVYVDKDADLDKALEIAIDSKVDYPAACNAAECLLVCQDVAPEFLPAFKKRADAEGIVLHVDDECRKYIDGIPLKKEDEGREYLSLEMNVLVVNDVMEAVRYITEYGSGHTDSIVTENDNTWHYFEKSTDSADVFRNASTRFADGFRFGLGAEVGISTGKIHARGPVGLMGLTSYKWILEGDGDTVGPYSRGEKEFHHRELV